MNGNGNGKTVMDWVNSFGTTATNIYGALNPRPTTTVVQAPAAQQPGMNWTPWAIGAGVLVVVVLIVSMLGGRK